MHNWQYPCSSGQRIFVLEDFGYEAQNLRVQKNQRCHIIQWPPPTPSPNTPYTYSPPVPAIMQATLQHVTRHEEVQSSILREEFAERRVWDFGETLSPRIPQPAWPVVQVICPFRWVKSRWVTASWPKHVHPIYESNIKFSKGIIFQGHWSPLNCLKIPLDSLSPLLSCRLKRASFYSTIMEVSPPSL